MTFLHATYLGIIEGITEFLPISSTAHLDMARTLFHIKATDFVLSFLIVIQFGAILAVLALYARKIFSSWRYITSIAIAFIPTAVIGFALYKIIKTVLLGNTILAAVMLVVGGVVILIIERRSHSLALEQEARSIDSLSTKELLLLGVAQALAVVPGVSRSGAVIVAGRAMGLSRMLITEFSFLLAIPTMFAAASYDLLKSGMSFTGGEWQLLAVGLGVSFVIALLVVRWLIVYVQKHSFAAFGWYRIIIGLLFIGYLFI